MGQVTEVSTPLVVTQVRSDFKNHICPGSANTGTFSLATLKSCVTVGSIH